MAVQSKSREFQSMNEFRFRFWLRCRCSAPFSVFFFFLCSAGWLHIWVVLGFAGAMRLVVYFHYSTLTCKHTTQQPTPTHKHTHKLWSTFKPTPTELSSWAAASGAAVKGNEPNAHAARIVLAFRQHWTLLLNNRSSSNSRSGDGQMLYAAKMASFAANCQRSSAQ